MEEKIKASEMKTLNKTMVQFVLEKTKRGVNNASNLCIDYYNYAKFLSTPLSLGMFIPTDEYGNVLEEPYQGYYTKDSYPKYEKAFQQAKERVLFEGFQIIEEDSLGAVIRYHMNVWEWAKGYNYFLDPEKAKTIESLIPYNLTLTENALKNIL